MPSMQFLPGEELAPGVITRLRQLGMPQPTIYERDVGLCWGRGNVSDENRPEWSDFRVVDMSYVNRNPESEDARIWNDAINTNGTVVEGWLGNSGQTCQGMFSWALYEGHVPRGSGYVEVLLQFAKVHECDWARFMLAALHASSIMDADRSDLIEPHG